MSRSGENNDRDGPSPCGFCRWSDAGAADAGDEPADEPTGRRGVGGTLQALRRRDEPEEARRRGMRDTGLTTRERVAPNLLDAGVPAQMNAAQSYARDAGRKARGNGREN